MNANHKLPPVDPNYVPSVSLTKIPASSSLEEILEVISRDGGVILSNLISEQELDKIEEELEPFQKDDEKFGSAVVNADLTIIATQTKLIHGLVGKSPTLGDIASENPVLESVRNTILTQRFAPVWEHGGEAEDFVIHPLLNISLAFQMGYGAPRQKMHKDDFPYAIKHDENWDLSKEREITCFIAASKVTRENGGTLFIPGSHKWDDSRAGRLDETCFLEMDKGDGFIFIGSVIHGAGHHSVKDNIRKIYALFYIRGTMRQEENQFLAHTHKQLLSMKPKLLELIGFKMQNCLLGSVNSRDPMENLEGLLAAQRA